MISFSREIERKFTVEEFHILKGIYICACNKYQSNILTELIAMSAVQKFILFNLVVLK